MIDWLSARLDALGTVERGRSRHRPRNDPSLYGGAYPFFQTGDVKAAEFRLTDYSQTYNEAGLAQSRLWQPGTLCITIAANIAESAILGIPGCFPDSIVGFIPDPQVADVRFVKYLLDTTKLRMQAISRGTTQDNLSLEKLLSLEFSVPLLHVQRKIAAVLAAYDELIENNLRRIEILEEMAQAIYREWFVNFRYPRHEAGDLVDSPLGPIPEGWRPETFETIASEVRDGADPADLDPTTPYVGLEHIPRQSVALQKWGRVTDVKSKKWSFVEGDILFGKLRPYFHKVVETPLSGVCSTDAIVIRPRERYREYALLTAASPEFVGHATATAGGTDRPRAKWSDLAAFEILLPPDALLGQLSSVVRPKIDLILNLVRQNRNLREARDLLLPKLVSGEIDVSNLDIDTSWLAA